MKDSFNKQIIYDIEKGLDQTKEWWDEEKYIPSKKPSFAVAFRVAAGGEFFSFLLLVYAFSRRFYFIYWSDVKLFILY